MQKPCAHLICCTTASQVHCGKPVRNCFDWRHNLRNGYTKSFGCLRAQWKKAGRHNAKPTIVPGTSTNDLPASARRLSEHIEEQSESHAIPSDGPQARPHKFQRAHELLRFEWQRRQAPLVTWQDEDVLP